MTNIFKKTGLTISIIVLTTIAPNHASAQSTNTKFEKLFPSYNFCASLRRAGQTLLNQTNANIAAWNQATSDQLAKLSDYQNHQAEKLELKRKENNLAVKQLFADLSKNTTTLQERNAVDEFQTTILKAIDNNRLAVDNLLHREHENAKTLFNQHHIDIQNKLTTLKNNLTTNITAAQNGCDSKQSISTLRQTLIQQLIQNTEQYNDQIANTKQFTLSIQQIYQHIQQGIHQANMNFTATLNQARSKLHNELLDY